MLDVQPMLDALKSLLDSPAPVIEIAESGGREVFAVEQGRHEYAHLALRRHRLPPDLILRIIQASAAEIELWGDRGLDAGSLDEVFSG